MKVFKSEKGTAELVHADTMVHLQELNDQFADAIVTDPPYCSGGVNGRRQAIPTSKKYLNEKGISKFPDFVGDHIPPQLFTEWLNRWLREALRVLKPGGLFMCFMDWRNYPYLFQEMQLIGFNMLGVVAWDKTRATRPVQGRFRQQTEYVVVASRGQFQKQCDGYYDGVFKCSIHSEGRHHQVGKPLPLMRDLLAPVAKDGLILDPFAGSGSTGVAALQTGRRFYGIELSTEYFDIAQARLSSAERAEQLAKNANC